MTSFGNAFDTEFRKITKKHSHDEIPLFRALQKALLNLGSSFHVEEYHGFGHQVTFRTKAPYKYLRPNARCELSDLLIVVYSPRTKHIRLTYLQAKSERSPKFLSKNKGMEFCANLEQWFLLSQRPRINGLGSFNPPSTLLSSAILPSVGSFAFFYKIGGRFQIYYASADCLVPSQMRKYGKLQTNGPCRLRQHLGFNECAAANGNIPFAENLYQMKIGTPLDLAAKGVDSNVRNWFAQCLESALKSAASVKKSTILGREILNILGASASIHESDAFGKAGVLGARSVIVIRADAD